MATINDNDRTKNNTVVIILIFFLIFLIISSIIILSRFTISSKRASTTYEKSNDIKISKIEDVKEEKKETPVVQVSPESSKSTEIKQQPQQKETTLKPQPQVQPQQQTKPQQQKQPTQVTPKVQPQTKQKAIKTQKEAKPANYVINAKNIKKYHNILLKEFEGVKTVDYKVKWGDTLWKIALKYNTSAHTIYVLNAFDDPDLIICGTVIKVPVDFVLSKTKTNSILLELINKEKSSYENKFLNNNLYTFNFINIDYIFKENYIIEENRII